MNDFLLAQQGMVIAGNHMRKGSIHVYENCGKEYFELFTTYKSEQGVEVQISQEMVNEIKNHIIIRQGMLYSFFSHFLADVYFIPLAQRHDKDVLYEILCLSQHSNLRGDEIKKPSFLSLMTKMVRPM